LRSNAGVTIVSCGALALALFAGQAVRAQSTPAQTAPAAQPPAAEATYADSTNELSVTVGKSVLVDCAQPIQRVAIGVGDIAEATAISPTEIMVDGKAAGETSLIIWDIHGGRQFFNVTVRAQATVTGDSLDAIRRELRAELPGQTIRVSYSNNNIFLRGTVSDLVSSTRAVQIASSAGKVVNLLDVDVPKSDPQILIKVRFASVDRNRARQLGINLFNLGLGNAVGGVTTGQFSPPSISGNSGGGAAGVAGVAGAATFSNEFNLLAFFPGLGVGADISALETKGIVQVLAEPNVMATNGKEASFLAGGEFPYPVVQGTAGGSAAVTIQFKEYGIRINFIPTITPRGNDPPAGGARGERAGLHQRSDHLGIRSAGNHDAQSEHGGGAGRRRKLHDRRSSGQNHERQLPEDSLHRRHSDPRQVVPIGVENQERYRADRGRDAGDRFAVSGRRKGANPNFPVAFLPPNSNTAMHQPDAKTPENTLPASPASIPVETLVDSMKPEKPLIIESGAGGFGTGGAAINSGAASSSTAGAAPPQQ
jgi:pilus assembly protein CpaC